MFSIPFNVWKIRKTLFTCPNIFCINILAINFH
ncbi:unnamed protein product [Acanthoscelides obtectus]|uniref:Uncharacterized protein n=1 Tax=Acanthoscelides obtectus TaxID=200917 RepID=A0A9P0L7E1_ACAOB|nr:unnamed protein product [Acanthoscelides obtectus]CAK1651817.1 hypothetical protein AOBTE_LOCUS17472 [Acanthoscelides obtectus]